VTPKDSVRIKLLPSGRVLELARGTALHDVLFAEGVEFPCGGRGRCRGCRVRLLDGTLPVSAEEARRLTPAELAAGWRLACQARADGDLTLDLAQWETTILTDESPLPFKPQEGLGVAVDLGTTTLAAQLLDLQTGQVLAVRTALNRQARFGADIMSRVEFAVLGGGQAELTATIRAQVGQLVAELLDGARAAQGGLRHVVLVGNTVMHHLFCGLSLEPLARVPFDSPHAGLQVFQPPQLGWSLPGSVTVRFLPCLGSFVGSDLLAGVLSTGLHRSEPLTALVDLGTNGEIVLGNRGKILCASAAAGPAFEGARISVGMRAATGAVAAVTVRDGTLQSHVLGGGPARGVCGSGLVDAVAGALELGWLDARGRLVGRDSLPLAPTVQLTRADIRELQLAKGAIAAGLRLLLDEWGATPSDLERLYLAGAFGNYISIPSARRIGLLELPSERVEPVGNTALRGAKLVLLELAQTGGEYPDLLRKVRHVSLNEHPRFQETFVDCLSFPQA